MAKKTTSGKNPFSRDTLLNEEGSELLEGQVQALAAQDSAAQRSPMAASRSTAASEPGLGTSTDAGQTAMAAAPSVQAAASFSVNKVYQHWADGDAMQGTSAEWNNNILSDSKSDYFEGEVVPHVFYYKASNSQPLVNGQTYSFNVTYNHYQANTNAGGFLFMTTPDLDRDPTEFSGTEPTTDASFTNGGGTLGSFQTVDADITGVSDVTYTTQGGGTMDGHVTITFVYTGPTTSSGGAEIQYGLMIASPGDVPDQGNGPTLGATAWTGGSLQTTVDIDGRGATSLQLMTSAIIDGEISGMKFNDMDGNGVRDADGVDNLAGTADDEVGMAGWTIFLDQDADGVLDAGERSAITDAEGRYSFSVTPDADPSDPDNDAYVVREVQQTGWVQTSMNPEGIVITAMHPKVMDVNFGNQQPMPSLNIVKDASVPGGTANVVGEVITYTITVQNTGNQMLTGVTVNDPMVSDLMLVADAASADGELDVGETWSWTGTHVVTQADIDAGGYIVNVATADSNQTGPDTDDASVAVEQAAALNIVKDASVAGGTANAAGEVIDYTIAVSNTGNQTLTGVTVADPFASNLVLVADAASADGELDVGETWSYTASHVVTQAEIDAGTPIVNVATADSNQTGPDTDDASVAVEQSAALNIVKDASVAGGTANAAGEVIDYTIAVSNTGNQTLTGVTVADPFASTLVLVADAASADGELDVGETWSYTASHVVTQAEIDAGTAIVNVATADSNQTGPDTDDASVAVEQSAALNIVKDAVIAGGTANAAGEVIDYTIAVSNTGNQTLTGVTVADPFASNLLLVADAASADGELDVGETWSYTASHVVTQAEIDAGSDIVNVATADSNQTEPDTDDASVAVEQSAALNIVKDAVIAGGTANAAGEVIDYTIAVSNTGNQTLTGVTVADPFASNLVLVADAASADGELDVGETWSYTASHVVTQAEIDAGTAIVNVATADSNQTGPDTDDAAVTVEQSAALNIVKDASVAGGTANAAGEVIDYTIAVSNTGNQTLTGVTVVDPFASNLLLVADAASADGELDVGETWSYTASHVVTQAEIDVGTPIVNVATADSNQTGPDTDDASVAVEQTPGLNIVKDAAIAGGTANAAGEVIDYTISVSNTGNQTLTGVTVADPFASNLVLVADAASADGELDVGETWSYTASHVVTQAEIDAGGPIVNVATADSNQTDPDTDDASVAVEQAPGLNIVKDAVVAGGTANAAGEVIDYTIAVSNTGNQTLTGVTVADPFASNLVLVANAASADGELDVGETWSYTASHVVTQAEIDAGTAIVNVATADSNQTGPDTDDASVTVEQTPGLNIVKDAAVAGGTANAAGEVIDYTISVQNTGNQTLTGVTVADPFISNLTLVANAASADGELDVGETWSYTASHVVTQGEIDAGTAIVNVATADSNQTGPDTDDAAVTVEQSAALNIVKDASVAGGTANAAGEVIDYTIAVSNTGNQTLTGVTVVDPFASNLLLVADAASADGELDVGETWSYTASHVVTQAEIDAGTPIVNVATADSNQTGPDTDDASVAVEQTPGLNIVKDAAIAGGTANAAGEVIDYTISVQNTGNQTLTGVTVVDPFASNLLLVANAASADGELDVGETWSYTASHVVTQAEMNAGTPIVNVATADSVQTSPDTDDASVAVEQAPAIAVDKAIATITGGNGNTSADAAGDVLNYTVTVSNAGNVSLTDVVVTDALTGLNVTGVTLAPGESQTYLTSYVLTQQDLDSNGGGDGYVENTATADSAQTGLVSDVEPIQVLPRPSLALNKSLVSIIGGNGNAVADAAGDVLQYTATVINEGNVTLTNVSVTDVSTGLNVTGLTLAPGESAVYGSTYTLTQADVDSNGDGDGYHDNIALADSDQTAQLSDAESTPLLRTIGLGVEKNVTSITGGNNNGFADQAGESLNYSINVYNAGTVTLTNVTVVDDLTGLSQTIASLAPGANQLYQTSYTLTQADLDSNGGGNGYIENATVVDSDQTLPGVDNETVQLIRSPVLYLDKTFVNVTGGNGNNLIDAVGDVLNYRIVVANPSNVTLTEVSIAEPLTGLTVNNLTLAPGQTQTYLTSYTLTQADIDNNGGGDGYIDNVAVADSAQTTSVSDIESVPVLRTIGMDFDKGIVGINGGNGNDLADAAGDVLNYVFTVNNPGSVTLTNLTVVDNLTGLSETLASLAPGATVTYNSSYVLTQADLDSNAGGDGVLINTATADSSETPAFTDSEGVTVVYQPIIDLTKYVSVDNGVTWDDANGPTGPLLLSASGIDPQFRYTVTNSGNITLGDVTLTDAVYDLNGAEAGTAYSFGSLAVGASAEFIFTGAAWAEGQQSGDAAVSVASMPTVLDIDNAYYLGV